MRPLLLDTCAAIWLAEDAPVGSEVVEALAASARQGVPVYVSPMTAWELGMLVARRRLTIAMDPQAWFERFLVVPGVALAALTPRTLIASSFLPGEPPRDPVDRMLIATARDGGYRLVTRDRRLLDYAAAGHVAALAC